MSKQLLLNRAMKKTMLFIMLIFSQSIYSSAQAPKKINFETSIKGFVIGHDQSQEVRITWSKPSHMYTICEKNNGLSACSFFAGSSAMDEHAKVDNEKQAEFQALKKVIMECAAKKKLSEEQQKNVPCRTFNIVKSSRGIAVMDITTY